MVIAPEGRAMNRLKKYCVDEVVPTIMRERHYKNIMEVPRLEKIVVNMGLGEAIQNIKVLDSAVAELSLIVGQRPVVTRARRSIAAFKLREGMAIGCMATLRRDRMYEFLDRLINVAIPRVRDFRGLNSRAFDGRGNYTLGVREQIIFPEVDYDKVEKVKGMNITIVTSAKTDEEGYLLLKLLGMPFRN
jgi:large subunit ribosomal protein L5